MIERMEQNWNSRAKDNAKRYIATLDWQSELRFDLSGMKDVIKLLNGLERVLHHDMEILDIGCGIGRMDKFLALLFRQVHGVDVSAEMVRQGKQRLKDLKNVFLYKNDGKDLSLFSNESFDLVFSYITFQHIPRKIVYGYFKEVYRVLKKGGVFRFQIPFKSFSLILYRSLIRKPLEPSDEETWEVRFYSKTEIEDILNKCGLKIVEIRKCGTIG